MSEQQNKRNQYENNAYDCNTIAGVFYTFAYRKCQKCLLYKKPKDQNFTGIYTHSTRLRKGYAKGYNLTLSDTIKLHIDIYKLGNTILIDLHALNTGECKPQSKNRIGTVVKFRHYESIGRLSL